jgi:hypothetical protein
MDQCKQTSWPLAWVGRDVGPGAIVIMLEFDKSPSPGPGPAETPWGGLLQH